MADEGHGKEGDNGLAGRTKMLSMASARSTETVTLETRTVAGRTLSLVCEWLYIDTTTPVQVLWGFGYPRASQTSVRIHQVRLNFPKI